MIRKKIVWFGIKLYGLIGKFYGLERNCMVSNHESYGLGRVWGRQVCLINYGVDCCGAVEKCHGKILKILHDTFQNHAASSVR